MFGLEGQLYSNAEALRKHLDLFSCYDAAKDELDNTADFNSAQTKNMAITVRYMLEFVKEVMKFQDAHSEYILREVILVGLPFFLPPLEDGRSPCEQGGLLFVKWKQHLIDILSQPMRGTTMAKKLLAASAKGPQSSSGSAVASNQLVEAALAGSGQSEIVHFPENADAED